MSPEVFRLDIMTVIVAVLVLLVVGYAIWCLTALQEYSRRVNKVEDPYPRTKRPY